MRVGKATQRRPATKKAKRPNYQSLLVLHLDATKLREDGLHFEDVSGAVELIAKLRGSDVELADIHTQAQLNARFATLTDARRTFDVVVIVGHSNDQGIRVAADLFLKWEQLAILLRPLSPRRLLLIACKGGRSHVAEHLFRTIRPLRRIFACPVNANRDFGSLLMFAVPYVLEHRRPRTGDLQLAKAASALLSGRQLREWTRSDQGSPEGPLLDAAADLADGLVRGLSAEIRSWILPIRNWK